MAPFPRSMVLAFLMAASGPWAQAPLPMAPSPLVPGYHADPHIAVFGERFYLYTTGYNCFSSPDLVAWTRHANPFDLRTLKWGEDKAWLDSIKPRTWAPVEAWAPAVAARNGKYYFYFSANHYLGIAVGDKPAGPFQDAVGRTVYNRWDGIDPMTFIDDDGEAYVFFGYAGQFGGVAVGILNPDMISWKTPPRIIANNTNGLRNYLEGPFMFKRKGIYYLTYSNDTWQTPNYNVQYATAEHPLGPYTWKGRILEKDANHVGPGHHSILQIPGRDQWYIVYHRYSNTQTTANVPRTTHIDTLRFLEDGSIAKVTMTNTGVRGVSLAGIAASAGRRGKTGPGLAKGWPLDMRLSVRGLGLRVDAMHSGSAVQLEVFDSRGGLVASRKIRGSGPSDLAVPQAGAYWAVLRTGGARYRVPVMILAP